MLRRSPLLAPRRENLGESGQGAAHIDEIAPLPTHVFKSYVVDVEAHGACHAHEEVLMGDTGHSGVPAGQDL